MLLGPIVVAIVFSIISIYILNVEITVSAFLFEIVMAFLLELIIGTFLSFGRDLILAYKKDGFLKTTIIVIVTIIALIGYIYVKYNW